MKAAQFLLVLLFAAAPVCSHAANPTLTLSNSSIAENQVTNSTVGTLGSDAASRTFTLVSGAGSTDNTSFNISGSTLRSSAAFDYEATPTKTSFSVRVRVANTTDSTTTESPFTLTLTDVNEAPSFDLSELTNPQSTVALNENADGTFANFYAVDVDAVSSVVFSIFSGNSSGAFSIDANSGVLAVADPEKLDYESVSGHAFSLVIRASDAVDTNLYAARSLAVTLGNVHPSLKTTSFSVFNGAPAGSVIGIVEANNPDNGTLSYEFVSLTIDGVVKSGASVAVDSTTGVVTFAVDSTTLFPNANPDNPPVVSIAVKAKVTGTTNAINWSDEGTGNITLKLQLLAGGSPVLVDVLSGGGLLPDSKATPSRGDPVQSVAAGPNGEIIVLGMTNNQSFLKIYPQNIADPVTVNLVSGFIPSSVVADDNGIFVGGQMGYNAIDRDANLIGVAANTEPSPSNPKPARVYKFNFKGQQDTETYPFGGYADSMITAMTVSNGEVYVCGGMRWTAIGTLNPKPYTYAPIWKRLSAAHLGETGGPGSLDPNAPGNKTSGQFGWTVTRCYYGTYTAIAVDPNGKVVLGGYILSTPSTRDTHLQWGNGFMVRFEPDTTGAYSNDSAANAWLADGNIAMGSWAIDGINEYALHFVNDLKFVDTGTQLKLFALISYRDNANSLPPGDAGADAVKLKSMSLKIAKMDPYFTTNTSVSNAKAYIRGNTITDIYDSAGAIIVNESRAGSLAADPSGNVYVTGSIPAGAVTFGTKDVSRPNPRFFVAKYGNNLGDPEWLTLLDEGSYKPEFKQAPAYPGNATALAFPSTPGNPMFGPMLGVWSKKLNSLILAGTYVGGDLVLRNNNNVNSVSVAAGKRSGFMTLIGNEGSFVGGSGLVIDSVTETDGRTVGNSALILPYLGAKPASVGTTYTVEAPKIIYIDASGSPLGTFAAPPSDSVIQSQAVTRYINTGLTVGNTVTGADSRAAFTSTSNRYTFTFVSSTRVSFHWAVEHRMKINSAVDTDLGLATTSTALGNPEPAVSTYWVPENQPTTAFIDGVANDPTTYGKRARAIGFDATGSVTQNLTPPVTGTMYRFDAVQTRQQVPQWVMSGPATITYRWKSQYHVMTSTSVQAAQTLPQVRTSLSTAPVVDQNGYGSGEHWFDSGTHVYVGSLFGGGSSTKQLRGWIYATAPFASNQGDYATLMTTTPTGAPGTFVYKDIASLTAPVTVLWDFGSTIHKATVQIGNSVDFANTAPPVNGGDLTTTQTLPPDRRTVVDGPQGSTGDEMALWDPYALKLYPVRPGKLLLEYGSASDPLVVELTIQEPTASIVHINAPGMPGISLDPSDADATAFQQLAYTAGNASTPSNGFLSTVNGVSVIVFTQRDAADTSPANGDPTKERLVVQVVQTKQWNDPSLVVPTTSGEIGKRLTHLTSTAAVLDTGFIVHPNARYNANIYDRTKTTDSGPIIPVNQQFTGSVDDELVVIWYAKPDPVTGIAWTHSVEKFNAQWPTTPGRIVIASRLGSEGKASDGTTDQTSFSADLYDGVSIYNQADRTKPGFNPNEEHALIAPSFLHSDQALPPSAAYALQTGGLNVLHDVTKPTSDSAYSSDPYVLVQYFDKTANQVKMAVYIVEAEDANPLLNPQVYKPIPTDPSTWRNYGYSFDYTMTAGEPVVPPYPLLRVIGLSPSPETFGFNTTPARVYWEDYNNVAYAAGSGAFSTYFHYRITGEFWGGEGATALSVGTSIPFGTGKVPLGSSPTIAGSVVVKGTSASGTANVFTGSVKNPVFAKTGTSTFTVQISPHTVPASAPIRAAAVVLAGKTAKDFIKAVLMAFPNGEVAAAQASTGELQLIVRTDIDATLIDSVTGNLPLTKAGFVAASNPPAGATVRFGASTTSPMPVPLLLGSFEWGSTFKIDTARRPATSPVTITLTQPPGGAASASGTDLVNAVNAAAIPGLKASITPDFHIQFDGTGIPAFMLTDGTHAPLAKAGLRMDTPFYPVQEVRYFAEWPTNPPVLKAGETLTYAGGEHKADHPEAPGLPGVLGWAVGEVIYDSLNPLMADVPTDTAESPANYTARLISPLTTRRVPISIGEEPVADAAALAALIAPATKVTAAMGTVWKFTGLPASLGRRLFYDPLNRQLGIRGYVNGLTLGDSTLTAAPPPVYVLEPDVITPAEKAAMLAIPELAQSTVWKAAVNALYKLCRDPNQLSTGLTDTPYYVGLTQAYLRDQATQELVPYATDHLYKSQILKAGTPTIIEDGAAMQEKLLGPGLALVPSAAFLDPNNDIEQGYVTLVENNDKAIGGPVTLRVIKVLRDERYRGAIKTILPDNVFSEQLTMRHSGDFGGNADDLVYQWFYREEDGTESALPPGAPWNLFADTSNNDPRGLGMYQIELKGNPILLLADQLFFLRYRHKNEIPSGGPDSTDWAGTNWEADGAEWAGAANSRPGDYQPQLASGWVKRVLDRINPYEARFSDFKNNAVPATYSSMIQEAGQQPVGPVALNPDKNVVENVGLLELYQTVLDRGKGLSIDLSSPVSTGGINNALLLAATRISDLNMLLGNEAFSDAQDPTIGFGSTSADYGSAAPSIFTFQNQTPSLLDEELSLLRGVSQDYGRPVFNRLFWNFTKSEGEVAYAMNYHMTDINKDGFIDENDARVLYPQGHGDAWGYYLSALKGQYSLMRNPYFNWVSRSEFYTLLDVVIKVDFLDERKFADAAAAKAKAGAEIVNMTYRSRYVEDPDGQWQGYADTDSDRAWGVDGWARRAGQGAYFDWVAANALLPAVDPNPAHVGIQKVDRTTVTSIHNISAQLNKIQATEDDANGGLNPLGLAPDAVPFDFDPDLAKPGDKTQTHFEQMMGRAESALANAAKVFDHANLQANRLRMQATTTDTLSQQSFEQDRDYRNRLIEIFGTPYAGQIGAGKMYPEGYNGPDLATYMYVAVNDLSNDTVPPSSQLFEATWKAMPQMLEVANPAEIDLGPNNPTVTPESKFRDVISRFFISDVFQFQDGTATNSPTPGTSNTNNINNPVFSAASYLNPDWVAKSHDVFEDITPYLHTMDLDLNLPLTAVDYAFRVPADGSWGMRASPGELQSVISQMVQEEAALGLANGDYDGIVQKILHQAADLRAQHGVDSATIMILDKTRQKTYSLDTAILGLKVTSSTIAALTTQTDDFKNTVVDGIPKVVGLANDVAFAVRLFTGITSNMLKGALVATKLVADNTTEGLEIQKSDLATRADIEIQKLGFEQGLRQKLTDLEGSLYTEAAKRIEVFRRVQIVSQVSDRYRATLQKGQALLDERADFNRRTAGAGQLLRYQDMAFRVFRNDALQKYRASFDLAAKYAYLAAKTYDYETNLSPNDPGSAQPLLQDIVRARTLGTYQNGASHAAGGLSDALATLRDNYAVLKGRLGLNNPQLEASTFSLRREMARIPLTDPEGDYKPNITAWRQLLANSRKTDLWEVPEFRRFCRPPVARSAGKLPGLVISFKTQTKFGENFFGNALAAADSAYNPSNFANKIASVGISIDGYPASSLAATPQVYLVPAGQDIMTVPNSPDLQTRAWTIIDQAIPVPFPVGAANLRNPNWIPIMDGLSGPMADIRRFSSFRAGSNVPSAPMTVDTRLVGRSVWNTNWLLIIPGGSLLNDGEKGLDKFKASVTDIKLYFNTYGYSGN